MNGWICLAAIRVTDRVRQMLHQDIGFAVLSLRQQGGAWVYTPPGWKDANGERVWISRPASDTGIFDEQELTR